MRLKDKVILIVGATGGLGTAITEKFLAEGAYVMAEDACEERLVKLCDRLGGQYPGRIQGDVSDITDYDQMVRLAEKTKAAFGRIDALVNMAGILIHKPIGDLTVEDWKKVLDVNLTGAFYAMKAVIPYMKEQNYGKIINASSVGARTARHGVGVNYSATKGALISMSKTLAGELGKYHININVIAPGPINSPMFFSQSEENIRVLRAGIPLERLGEPEDIANCALFLASDESGWITGQTIDVSGGIVMNS